MLLDKSNIVLFAFEITFVTLREVRQDIRRKKVVYFRSLPDLATPPHPIRATWSSFFLDFKTTFCAYDRKNVDDDNDDCNDNYDSNDGNFDDNDDKKGQTIKIL